MTIDYSYAVAPFFAWFVTGVLKFLINTAREKRLAFELIGYGGMPSNHSAIVASMVALIAIKEGVANPAFGIAVTLAFIVLLDAGSLRRQIGRHAEALNELTGPDTNLRERMGHKLTEIVAGLCVGIAVGYLASLL